MMSAEQRDEVWHAHRAGKMDRRAAVRRLVADGSLTVWAADELLAHRSPPTVRIALAQQEHQDQQVRALRWLGSPEGPPATTADPF